MGEIVVKTRKPVVLAAMLGSHLAFGEDRDPCYEAYPQSALTHQQKSFEQFREMYRDKGAKRRAPQRIKGVRR